MDQTWDVYLELVTHGNHDLLDEKDDGVLDGAVGTPEILRGCVCGSYFY